jgi:hypothetical protein
VYAAVIQVARQKSCHGLVRERHQSVAPDPMNLRAMLRYSRSVGRGSDHSHGRSAGSSLAQTGRWSYALAKTPAAALELLQAPSNPPVVSIAEAERRHRREPFIVLEHDGFTIYKPWPERLVSVEGVVATEHFAIGPAVTGRLVATPRGSRLDVEVKRYAPVPSQRFSLVATTVGLVAGAVAMIVATAAHPIILTLVAICALGLLSSVLFFRHQQRSQDIRELLAVVERTFGPLELPTEGSPHRHG